MNDVNLTLGSNLEKAREDIDALKIEIENVRKESMIDPLTQIPNRKAFDFSLDLALKSSERNGDKLSLMLLDIDHFKAFNDNHGHQTGDQVLKLVAGALNKRAKGDYVAARYGGEEFGIVMPGACLEDATQTAEYLRKTIGERELHNKVTQEPLGRITASFGVADYRDGDTASTLIERADKCLYRAKKNGRDIVVNADHMAMSTASQQAQKSA